MKSAFVPTRSPLFPRFFLALSLLLVIPAMAGAIPLTEVTLFTSGVGEFVHETTVVGNGTLELTVTLDAMDDVLRSLTIVDRDGGTVSIAEYPNGEPALRRLGRFPIDLGSTLTLGQLLNQMRGTEVEVEYLPSDSDRSRTVRGTIIGSGRSSSGRDRLLIAENEILREVSLDEITDLALQDQDRLGDLTDALDALAAASTDSGLRTIAIHYEGTGRRRIVLRYLREMPVWRTSYRAVTGDRRALIQGWAHIDNTSSLDWDNVELSIVSANPNTYRFPIYEPSYVSRGRGTTPGRAEPAPAPSRAMSGSAARDYESDMAFDEYLADTVAPQARTQTMQTGIAFTFPQPVSIARGDAAMIPLVQEEMEAEVIRVYDPRRHGEAGEASLRFINTARIQLPSGPITIYEGSRYVGDAVLPLLAAGELVTLTYAGDISFRITRRVAPAEETLTTIRIVNGVLLAERLARRSYEYEIEHRGASGSPGEASSIPTLEIQHPEPSGWDITSPRTGIRRPGTIRFTARPPSLTVVEEQLREQRFALTSITDDQLSFYSNHRLSDPAVQRILRNIAQLRRTLAERTTSRSALEARRTEIVRDQERLRGNMAVLDRNSSLYRRYSTQLSEQEDELDTLEAEIADAVEREQEARRALTGYIETL